ncbi:tetratricopeptide repeat protein 25 [Plakobranchus ocellatus]|uniref:Outer dynein arm-docking complex subunit 4 n=1 Tax=Plakobranchus ocellatus TaxID=259542 RepID=A0AAV4A1C0_9GAST|nr:tetratricopeptide repeat protein 25 [Plakobranchus ocellatus]
MNTPLQMPRRSNMKERSFFFGSKESLDTIASARSPRAVTKTNEAAELSESDGQAAGKPEPAKRKTVRRPKKRQKLEVAMGLERDCTSINFKFNSLQESRSASRIDTGSPEPSPLLTALKDTTGRGLTRLGRMRVGVDKVQDRKREVTRFINKEMDSIDEAFKNGEFAQCKHKAETCLDTVTDLDGEEINKSEVMASLYSCMGNASIAMNDFDAALNNHLQALHIGETENLKEVINRSLGHLGRMYIIQKRFNKALEVFARKAPTVVSAEEVAQVFHEIGNCFLALGHLDYARDCGKKALRAAEDADIHYFKFQSWVLIAVSESRMKHHEEAYKAFQCALDLAKKKGEPSLAIEIDDQESMTVILFALEHLSKTITSILKKREMLSDRLSSRSKTQALIDLNKRPHAARQKKRKKRLRREATTLDGPDDGDDMLTRQNTMIETGRTFHLASEDTIYQRSPQPHLPPLPQHPQHQEELQHQQQQQQQEETTPSIVSPRRRGSLMFEENPRELEPFADPRLKSRQGAATAGRADSHVGSQYQSISPHKRHGLLEHIEHRGEGGDHDTAETAVTANREKPVSQGKLTPRTPRGPSKVDSPAELRDGEKSRSSMVRPQERVSSMGRSRLDLKMNLASPRGHGEDGIDHPGTGSRELSPQKQHPSQLSPHPNHDVSGVLSELSETPRDGKEGNVSEREYVLMTDRTGMTSQSDLDIEGLDTFRGAEALANRHRNVSHFQVQERNLSRRSADLRDTSIDERDTTLDWTHDITSGGPGHNRSGLTSGQYADLSCTADESMELPSIVGKHRDNEDANTGTDYLAVEEAFQPQDASPRRRRTHRTSREIPEHGGAKGENTPGRFTRESFFEEEEEYAEAARNATENPDETFDLVSVSRQHILHPRQTAAKGEGHKLECAESGQRQFDTRDTCEDTDEKTGPDVIEKEGQTTPRPAGFERQSSKVSLKGRSHEAGEVTLETTRPYRVSSAKTSRNISDEGKCDANIEDAGSLTKEHAVLEDRGNNQVKLEYPSSPAKTPKSHVTTGSGWDGDVSMESALGGGGEDLALPGPTATGEDNSKLQPTLSRQKTKIKHKKKSDRESGDKIDDFDDEDDIAQKNSAGSKQSLPKLTPRKRVGKRSTAGVSEDAASAADDEDDGGDEQSYTRADNTSLNKPKSQEAPRSSGNSETKVPMDSAANTSLVPEKMKEEVLQGNTQALEDQEAERLRLHQERRQAAKEEREEKALTDISSVPISKTNNEESRDVTPPGRKSQERDLVEPSEPQALRDFS